MDDAKVLLLLWFNPAVESSFRQQRFDLDFSDTDLYQVIGPIHENLKYMDIKLIEFPRMYNKYTYNGFTHYSQSMQFIN